jgi:murein DD-endopeptidase MepM/ murein hydrolase activator NlpD
MSPAPSRPRSGVLAAALVSFGLAGCASDTSRFSNPFADLGGRPVPPTEVTAALPTSANPAGVPSGRVDSGQLPPPSAHSIPRPYSQQTREARVSDTAAGKPSATSVVHVVKAGETLSSLSRHYHVPRAQIAKANGLSPNASLQTGQRVTIPGVSRVETVNAAAKRGSARDEKPGERARPDVARSNPKPGASEQKVASAEPAATANLVSASHEPAEAARPGGGLNFRWPVHGRIISAFGARLNGEQNSGINLSVPEGTSIKAAEDGVVAYAGNELKGYGNLVLVRHADGYVTAYAHASEILVKRGDTVKRGQIIARAGQTGNVSSPQLHFEIRKGSTPVDPVPLLQGSDRISQR